MSIEYILLGVFIWIAFTSESITGFGSIVIALALGTMLFPIPELLPILVPLSVFMSSALLIRYHRDIVWPIMLKLVLPYMVVGMLVGIGLIEVIGSEALKALFAVLILWFAGRELMKLHRGIVSKPKPRWWQLVWTLLAGITHGLFASGGPLLVYALNSLAIAKANFRATLVSVWFGLNVTYTIIMTLQGKVQPVLPIVLAYVPVLVLAFWFGTYIHDRINERQFRQLVYILLLISAAVMLASVF